MRNCYFIFAIITLLVGCNDCADFTEEHETSVLLVPHNVNINDRVSLDFFYNSNNGIDSIIESETDDYRAVLCKYFFIYEGQHLSQVEVIHLQEKYKKTLSFKYDRSLIKCIIAGNIQNETIVIELDSQENPVKVLYENLSYDLVSFDSNNNIIEINTYTFDNCLYGYTRYLYDNNIGILRNANVPKWLPLFFRENFYSIFFSLTNNNIGSVKNNCKSHENDIYYSKGYPCIIHVNLNEIIYQLSINYKILDVIMKH